MALTDILSGAVSVAKSMIQPTAAIDVVAILGPGFVPLFSLARPLSATVTEDAQLMEHPLEMGSVIADHIVIEPMEIELPCVVTGELEYRNTYAAIKGAFKSGMLLTVVTRTGMYPNMVLTSIPHKERPQSFDAIEILVHLRHAEFVQPKSTQLSQKDAKDPSQSSTVNRGGQQTTNANGAKSGAASNAYGNSGQGSSLYRWFGQ